MTWKQVECPFERDRKILQYLLTVPVFSEDGEAIQFLSFLKKGRKNVRRIEYWLRKSTKVFFFFFKLRVPVYLINS
jgi:hypothetical protein